MREEDSVIFRQGEGREETEYKLGTEDGKNIRLLVIMELCCKTPAWWFVDACIAELKNRERER